MWLEGREGEEKMVLPRGPGKVPSKDGRGAGPIRNKGGVDSALGGQDSQGQVPTLPCPAPLKRWAGSGE